MGGRLLFKQGLYSNQACMQCRNPIYRVCTFYTYHVRGLYMSEGKKKLPILTYTWSIFENINLSGMVFTLEASGMSFRSAPGSFSWWCKYNAKKIGDLSKKGKSSNLLPSEAFLRFETLCRGVNQFEDGRLPSWLQFFRPSRSTWIGRHEAGRLPSWLQFLRPWTWSEESIHPPSHNEKYQGVKQTLALLSESFENEMIRRCDGAPTWLCLHLKKVVFVGLVAVFRGVNVYTNGHAWHHISRQIDLRYTLGLSEQFERDHSISHIHDIVDVHSLAQA